MPNGDPGLPNPEELPGDEPPPYIEGPTGGPAMPQGGGGAWSKEGATDYHQTMATMAGIFGMAAGFAIIGGWFIGGMALGLVALVTGLEADKISDIARDPPKPYEQPVINKAMDRLRATKPLTQGGRLSELLDRPARAIYATAYKRVQSAR